jgi:aquaporin related protein
MPDSVRNHFIATSGEFAGTFLFLFFAFSGTQVANTQTQGQSGSAIVAASIRRSCFTSACFGFSLAVNAWVFFRISGGLFNPAVSLFSSRRERGALLTMIKGHLWHVLVGALPLLRSCLLIFSQILGGIAAAAVVSVLFPGALNVQTSLGGGTSVVQGLFIEMFLSAELIFTIFMLAAEKHKGTFIAPVGIGLSLFIAELTGELPDITTRVTSERPYRRLLHWWVAQSSAVLRSERGSPLLLPLPLDLLARPSQLGARRPASTCS